MVLVDGSEGEGGGQILRSSLALSLVTGQPFRIQNIRARRQKPGLLKQHLTAVEAAKVVGCAEVTGAALGSQTMEFAPQVVTPGNYRFAVGTAGSATLVLQAILPALLVGSHSSTFTLEGGTHNPLAPSFDFLERCFRPVIQRLGSTIDLELKQRGFYPAGGGKFIATVHPARELSKIELPERGAIRTRRARVILSKLPEQIGQRELTVIKEELKWRGEECVMENVPHPPGPGNAVVLEIEAQHITAVFTAFGARGRSAEDVALSAVEEAKTWLETNVPVDEHLTDQLLLPMALAGGGSFRTSKPSLHTTTNAEVIRRFTGINIRMEQEDDLAWRIYI